MLRGEVKGRSLSTSSEDISLSFQAPCQHWQLLPRQKKQDIIQENSMRRSQALQEVNNATLGIPLAEFQDGDIHVQVIPIHTLDP